MDPELSFIQANLTQCSHNLFVLDPFCGTGYFNYKKWTFLYIKNFIGGLLLAASHFGALSLGLEINYLVARAKGRSSRQGEKILSDDQSIRANFKQYSLEDRFVGVLLADSSQKEVWYLNSLTSESGIFDAIITDRLF